MNYRRELSAARKRALEGQQIVVTALGTVACRTGGEQGVCVLVIHGAGGGHDMGMAMAQMLLPAGQRWIAPSRFGYLGSPVLADGSPAAQADVYAALLDHLTIRRVVAMAYSVGGPSALQFAARHPDRCAALVLLEAVSHCAPHESALVDAGFKIAFHSNLSYWLAIHFGRGIFLRLTGMSSEVRAHLTEDEKRWVSVYLQTMWPVDVRRAGLLNDMARLPYAPGYSPDQIAAPTLVVHAVDDALIAYENGEYAARHISGARLMTLGSGGHFMAGHHGEVRSELQRLLSQSAGDRVVH
jgi:pimeloyl-ACP methyl ester carboxylesterase